MLDAKVDHGFFAQELEEKNWGFFCFMHESWDDDDDDDDEDFSASGGYFENRVR
jgi:hypothetical protein